MFTSDVERLGQRLDADLLPVGSDQAYFTGPDPLVDPGIGLRNRRITLSVGGSEAGETLETAHNCAPFVGRPLQALLSTRRTSGGGRVGSREQLLDSHLPCKLSA